MATPSEGVDPVDKGGQNNINDSNHVAATNGKANGTPNSDTATATPSDEAGNSNNGNHGQDNAAGQGDGDEKAKPKPKKPGIMAKLGLDPLTIILMLKGGIAPVIALGMYQYGPYRAQYGNLGYLVGIISVLSLPILPRGKFIQMLILNLLGVSIGAGTGMLALWSAFQARLHTQLTPGEAYNSSQCAVAAVWLFFLIWLANTMRAHYPDLSLPVAIFSILANIACTYSPLMRTYSSITTLIQTLYTAMLTAFAIALIVSLFVIPVTSRKVTLAQLAGMLALLRGVTKQEKNYLQTLERDDMFAVPADISAAIRSETPDTLVGSDDDDVAQAGDDNKKNEKKAAAKSTKSKKSAANKPHSTPETEAVRQTLYKIRELAGKIETDLAFARRDVAWGKLDGNNLKEIAQRIQAVAVPLTGISTVIDIFQRLAEKRGWAKAATDDQDRNEEKRVWNEVMKRLHDPFHALSEAIDQGIAHASKKLDLLPPGAPAPKKKGKAAEGKKEEDVEAKGELVEPGDATFAEALRTKLAAFHDVRDDILRAWAKERGLMGSGSIKSSSSGSAAGPDFSQDDEEKRHRDQAQLYILLYLETLMQSAGTAVLELVLYADSRVHDGTTTRNRLIIPTNKTLAKWIASVKGGGQGKSVGGGGVGQADLLEPRAATTNFVYHGSGFAARDPEHLPPATTWEKIGNGLRLFSKFLGSPESTYGFRAACATLTIGIVAFLEHSYVFFVQQRLVWALFMVALGMTQTSGQSIFGFICRIGGTLVAMILSMVNWYIVDAKKPGIFVFLFIFIAIYHYFVLKYPQLSTGAIICIVTHVMIIGYELQAEVLGIKAVESSGQPWYPIYELAPYRLATVVVGCFVAFLWTIFPSPLTDRAWLRRDLGATLFLLANYFGAVHESLRTSFHADGGDPTVKGTPAHRLRKHRRRLRDQLMALLPSLLQHAEFQRWEPTIGGKFPREQYLDLIQRATRINSYLNLLDFSVATVARPSSSSDDYDDGADKNKNNSSSSGNKEWLAALSALLTRISPRQHQVVSALSLLSTSLESGHALPPRVELPRPFELTKQLEALQKEKYEKQQQPDDTKRRGSRGVLDARHMGQDGYAEFAVLQVCSTLICDDVKGLVGTVGEVVGTVDFGFHVAQGEEGGGGDGDSSSSSDDVVSRGGGGIKRD